MGCSYKRKNQTNNCILNTKKAAFILICLKTPFYLRRIGLNKIPDCKACECLQSGRKNCNKVIELRQALTQATCIVR